jgi:aryl-alcohol dehydrogenase-like predicted oxidoreductase
MTERELGTSGLGVSAVGLGCMSMSGSVLDSGPQPEYR